MARVYTRTGDAGQTGRLYGSRIPKSDVLIDALGDIDEAVAVLGLARATTTDSDVAARLLQLQRELFVVAADLSANPRHRTRLTPGISRVEPAMVENVEQAIDALTSEHPIRPVFLVPGSSPIEARIDLARTVVRRAERHVVLAKDADHTVSEDVLRYLNRLSDLLFVLGRQVAGPDEPASHE